MSVARRQPLLTTMPALGKTIAVITCFVNLLCGPGHLTSRGFGAIIAVVNYSGGNCRMYAQAQDATLPSDAAQSRRRLFFCGGGRAVIVFWSAATRLSSKGLSRAKKTREDAR